MPEGGRPLRRGAKEATRLLRHAGSPPVPAEEGNFRGWRTRAWSDGFLLFELGTVTRRKRPDQQRGAYRAAPKARALGGASEPKLLRHRGEEAARRAGEQCAKPPLSFLPRHPPKITLSSGNLDQAARYNLPSEKRPGHLGPSGPLVFRKGKWGPCLQGVEAEKTQTPRTGYAKSAQAKTYQKLAARTA